MNTVPLDLRAISKGLFLVKIVLAKQVTAVIKKVALPVPILPTNQAQERIRANPAQKASSPLKLPVWMQAAVMRVKQEVNWLRARVVLARNVCANQAGRGILPKGCLAHR